MLVKTQQKFTSRQSGTVIKVTKVTRSQAGNKFDRCRIADTAFGRIVAGTQRDVFADSIRRRYI